MINRSLKTLFLSVLGVFVPAIAWARYYSQPDMPDPGACAACAGGSLILIIVVAIAIVVINIALLVWVARDAKARGLDPVRWIVLVLFTGLIGLIIYLFSRPKGNLVQCSRCGSKRLETGAECPHCGNA